jgi:hypothetical protein
MVTGGAGAHKFSHCPNCPWLTTLRSVQNRVCGLLLADAIPFKRKRMTTCVSAVITNGGRKQLKNKRPRG